MAETPTRPHTPAANDGRVPARDLSDRTSVDPDAPTTRLPQVRPRPSADGASEGAGDRPTLGQVATSQNAAAVIPERPALAPGVRLAGQMQESAFIDPPWLIEREGSGYLQVNELLYHIAEQANGQQTIEEMAQKASVALDQSIEPDMVRRLVVNPLITQGLVARADGTVVETPQQNVRQLLQMSMKMAMVSPRLIEPLTAILRVLFWPPVLVTVLGAAVGAEIWMYVVHGVGGGAHDALYAPGLLLIAVGAMVLAAGFHELGHAAALRYAGGKVKAMGVGLYLVYPAFYTDVTDNYRLKRWERIRTDLGGFYFNLIFVLAVMALYVVTGWDFLLIVVVLINLEIVHQLLPFVRLDGYWVLADLTGIPDFFSHMAAFVRSVVPGLKLEGRRLPELKWWGKAVFAAYILITVPLLLFLVFITLKTFPRVIVTAWDSLRQQAGSFGAAFGSGDAIGMAAALVQMLFLALPMIGIVLTFYALGKRIGLFLWSWSKPSPTRKAISVGGVLATCALVAFLWAPQLPFTAGRPGPAYERTDFTPIRREERGTVFDAVGVAPPAPISRLAPVPTVLPSPEATAQAAPSPAAEPAAEPTVNSSPTTGPALAPAAKPAGPSPAVPTPAVAPTTSAPAPASKQATAPVATPPAKPAPAATAPAAPAPTPGATRPPPVAPVTGPAPTATPAR